MLFDLSLPPSWACLSLLDKFDLKTSLIWKLVFSVYLISKAFFFWLVDTSAIPRAVTTFPFPFLPLVSYEAIAVISSILTSQIVHSFLIFAKWLLTIKWSGVLSKRGSDTCFAPTSQSFKFPLSSNFLCWENHSQSLLLPHSLSFFKLLDSAFDSLS